MEMGQWVMGQLCDGSHGSWVTKYDPFPSLGLIIMSNEKAMIECFHSHIHYT